MDRPREWMLPSPGIFGRRGVASAIRRDADVTLADLWSDPNFRSEFAEKPFRVPVGIDQGGRAAFADISNDAILLVSGPYESGVRAALRCILGGLLMGTTPRDVQLILGDLRGDSYSGLTDVPHAANPPITDPREALDVLTEVIADVNSRLDAMSRSGVRHIADLAMEDRPPRIVILIDELLSLLRTDEAATHQSLQFLTGRGRSAGIHTILGTTASLSATDFVASNVTEQIAFDTNLISGARVSQLTLPNGRLAPGEFLWEPMEVTVPLRCQVVSVTRDQAEALSGYWRRQVTQ